MRHNSPIQFKCLLLCIVPAVFGLMWTSCTGNSTRIPRVHKGYIDLSNWDLERDGTLPLDGEWEFYWKKMVRANDTVSQDELTYTQVPGIWNTQSSDHSSERGSFGYGTYRVRVHLGARAERLGMSFRGAASAYQLYVDDQLMMSCGVVSDQLEQMKPEYISRIQYFRPTSGDITITMVVANNFHYHGGLWNSLHFGRFDKVLDRQNLLKLWDAFYIGALFILVVYHFWIYTLRRSATTVLFFAIICLIVAFRVSLVGEQLMYYFLNDLGTDVLLQVEYIDLVCLFPLFTVFLSKLLLKKPSKLIIYSSIVTSALWILLILFAPTHVYTRSLTLFNSIVVTAVLIVFFMSASPSRRHLDSPILFYVASAVTVVAVINDILYRDQLVQTGFYAQYIFFLFLLVQAYILASNLSAVFDNVERVSHQLQEVNTNLESIVADRTREIAEEKKRSEDLLANILPAETAVELKTTGRAMPKTYGMVTVLFTDFKDFTSVSERLSPELLVMEIDACFSAFDEIIVRHGIEKIKTVGDAYLCAAGMPVATQHHAEDAVRAALEIRDFVECRHRLKRSRGEEAFQVRIGIHTGPIVAGVVGKVKFAYDIWGDTVNLAARMEQNSDAGKINISGATFQLVRDKFHCVFRGKIEVKNKGEVESYFVEPLGSTVSS